MELCHLPWNMLALYADKAVFLTQGLIQSFPVLDKIFHIFAKISKL